ncbi:MAG TPA: glycosyltransferase family 2 protein [Acidimicrobiia bacterium]|nr:glycosyltransferase family 2 protein [Acidimicrobiia bacterium]
MGAVLYRRVPNHLLATCPNAVLLPPTGTVSLSIVLPAHNEEELLADTVGEIVAGMRARAEEFEVVVVENGSRDRTAAIARSLAADEPSVRMLQLADADYGAALRAGLLAATGDVVVNFDVDYYDLGFLDRAVARTRSDGGPAVVVGSKRAPGADDQRAWARRVVTWGFATLLRGLFRLRVSDTHGMKAMRRAAVSPLVAACRFDRDLFDTELVIRAERGALGVDEIPVTVTERRPSRTSIVRRVPRTLMGLVALRIAMRRELRTR